MFNVSTDEMREGLKINVIKGKRRNKFGFHLLCFDFKYKDNEGNVIVLSQTFVSLESALCYKKLLRAKKYLKYKANKKIKSLKGDD